MAISPLILIIVVFAGVFLFVISISTYFGSGTKFEANLGKIIPTLGSIFGQTTQTYTPATTTATTSTVPTTSNQTKCVQSGGRCMPIVPVSPLECKLEFLDESFCGKGFKCCIPR